MFSIDDMIEEAWLDGTTKYTVDFGGSNLLRVSDLTARDFGEKHPDFKGFVPFIAGAIYMKYKNFQREMMEKNS